MGRREGVEIKREGRKGSEEGVMMGKVNLGGEWWRFVGEYVNKNLEGKMEKLRVDGEWGERDKSADKRGF